MKPKTVAVWLTILGLVACDAEEFSSHPNLTDIQDDWLVTAEEAREWALMKHDNLPTLTGSAEWLN